MNRRHFLASSLVPALALHADAQDALKARPRLRTGLNCYSFRKELAAKTMTYDDVIRRAVEWDIDGVDMTVYWMPSTGPEFTLTLRRLAYTMGVEIYSISVRSELTKSSAADRRDRKSTRLNSSH